MLVADVETQKPKSLEDYEEEALAGLKNQKHTKGPKTIQKQVMKRPAGDKTSKASKITDKPLTCWGCIRCRGNVHGCDSCSFEGFQGLRLNGSAAWHAYGA